MLMLLMMQCIFSQNVFQWEQYQFYLYYNQVFSIQTGNYAYGGSGEFFTLSQLTTANFQTCTIPENSYITLNYNSQGIQHYKSQTLESGDYCIYIDLFFQGTWMGEQIHYQFNQINQVVAQYSSPTPYILNRGFCDNILFDIKSFQILFTLNQATTGQHILILSGTNIEGVSIKNFLISKYSRRCYPSCTLCSGPKKNECTGCYYGSPTSGECPECPSSKPFYEKYAGCKEVCNYEQSKFFNGFCQDYPYYLFYKSQIDLNPLNRDNFQYSILYDNENIDTTPKRFQFNRDILYGIFKLKSGIMRSIQIKSSQYAKPIEIIIMLILFDPIPINNGINFLINNTFYGSVQNDINNQLQFYNIKLYAEENLGPFETYIDCKRYHLYLFADIPIYDFTLTIIGNYSNSNNGFGLNQVIITSGYCPPDCEMCEVSNKCKKCFNGYYDYRDGTCIRQCIQPFQILNSSYCYDYDDETKYSKYLIQEFHDLTVDPNQHLNYQLIQQLGTNFLKGTNNYFSVFNKIRVFGGKFVWAQAIFQRVFQIPDPHHSITIGFYIIFGPNFPTDGSFIYNIENNTPKIIHVTSANQTILDEGNTLKIYEKITHNTQTLTIQWECKGSNNEPVQSFCGFYHLYIAVHYCQPYCSQCNNQFTCQSFNGTYDSNIIKFSQSQCQQNEYFQQDIYRCQSCPISCLTCISNLDCLTCKSTYTLNKLGCFCKQNQYEANDQCNDCPYECNQCLSPNNCIECLNSNFRKLSNGKCVCMDGYYEVINDPICKLCNSFCKICNGPTYNDCLTCSNIANIKQTGNTCQCQSYTYYDEKLYTCQLCSLKCETCFYYTQLSCLSCSASLNRVLKGLECKCKVGYYEDSNQLCIQCPPIQDITLNECYKTCIGVNKIWYTQSCQSCDSGFQLIDNECIPNCGDLQIVGYEQCEDGNNLLNDKCYNCQFQCPQNCQICDNSTILPCPDICGDGYITGLEECEDGNTIPYDGCYECKYQCQEPCTKCVKGKCQECATKGWQLDPTVNPWQCDGICYDGYTLGKEQCDDVNFMLTDGCKECKYFCREGCLECDYQTNECLKCPDGFIPESYYCKNVCGDGLIVSDPTGYFDENCDMEILDCRFSSSSESCQTSYKDTKQFPETKYELTLCSLCKDGYYLNNQKFCEPICNDGVRVNLEACDDSLSLPYKCQQCKPFYQNSCLTCRSNYLQEYFTNLQEGCNECKKGYNLIDGICYSICGDQYITEDEDCDDGNILAQDGCHFCKFDCQESCQVCYKNQCLDCKDGYEIFEGQCYLIESIEKLENIQSNFDQEYLVFLNNNAFKKDCQDICMEDFQYDCVKCIESNILFGHSYFHLQLYYESFFWLEIIDQKKYDLMDFNLYCLQLELKNFKITDKIVFINQIEECEFYSCNLCYQKQCLNCKSGYYLFDFQCIPNINDGILVEYDLNKFEQCDDGNLLQFDGCYESQISCEQNCQRCRFGQCVECQLNYELKDNQQCIPVCGDGIIAPYSTELCDDENQVQYDGCFNCKYECTKGCIYCYELRCMLCEKGYRLNGEYCEPICGDSYIIPQVEECEVGINSDESNCQDCKIFCGEGCSNCKQGQCYECQIGYQLNTGICQTVCGDKILLGLEECDDGNIIPYDGCFECKFQCSLNCQQCIEGVCQICDQDYILNKQSCEFQPEELHKNLKDMKLCGNGQINEEEACDDENTYPLDGCLNCQVEDNWICKDYGNCFYNDPPKIKLTYLNQKLQTQFVQFEFTQKIQINDNNNISLLDILQLQLDDMDPTDYTINIIDSFEDKFIIKVETQIEINIKPKLMVSIFGDITNQYNQPLESNVSYMFLKIPSFISESMREEAKQLKKQNFTMIIVIIVLASLSLILGDFDIFFESYSILQFQSFLKYINLRYPENLLIYFESSDQITVQPLLSFLKFDKLIEFITLKSSSADSVGKFKEYEQDSDLLANLQTQIIQIAFILLILSTKNLIKQLINQIINSNKHQYFLSWTFSKMGGNIAFKFQKLFSNLPKFIIFIEQKLNINQIGSILLLNAWDVLLKSFLFIVSFKRQSSIRQQISFVLSLLITGIYLYAIIKNLFYKEMQIKQYQKEIFFQGLELLRILLFQYILVFFQEAQVLQILLISIVNVTQIFIIIKQRKILANAEFISKISVDLSVALATLSSILYIDDFCHLLKNQQKSYIGQIQIYLLIFGIAIVALKLIFAKIIFIINYLKQKFFQQLRNKQILQDKSANPKLFLE